MLSVVLGVELEHILLFGLPLSAQAATELLRLSLHVSQKGRSCMAEEGSPVPPEL